MGGHGCVVLLGRGAGRWQAKVLAPPMWLETGGAGGAVGSRRFRVAALDTQAGMCMGLDAPPALGGAGPRLGNGCAWQRGAHWL